MNPNKALPSRNFFQFVGPALGIVLFSAILWLLHHELRHYHYQDILRELETLRPSRLCLALGLTVLNYLLLGAYEGLGFRYIHHPLKYRNIALASFVGYAFSNNAGFAMISGSTIRFRLYSAWGLSAAEMTHVVTFAFVSFWLGFLMLTGIVFLAEPISPPAFLHLPFSSMQPAAFVFIGLVGFYLFWSTRKKSVLKIRNFEFIMPSFPVALAQISISLLDWILAAAILYVLLPAGSGISFFLFLGIFLMAQIIAISSQIPGGLGIFETVIVVLLSGMLPAPSVLGSLLAYRSIYYFLPLGIAIVLFGTHEILDRKENIKQAIRIFGEWVPELAPNILAFTTFLGGIILLFSGATPAIGERIHWLKDFLPLPVLELSHFLGSVVGTMLLLLAVGLQRRLNAAYPVSVGLLGGGIVLSLLKGLDYEEAIALSLMLMALLPCRKHFYRKTSLYDESFTPGWMASIAIVLICSAWLGFFSYKHVDYSHQLWWQFAFREDAPRSLRAAVGSLGFILLVTTAKLLGPAQAEPQLPTQEDLNKAREIIKSSKRTSANLALLGDKDLFFSKSGNTFLMYGIRGKSWVALGNPVGQKEEIVELAWEFREMCDQHGGWAVFYDVGQDYLPLYLDLGLTLIKSGEEARVSLTHFNLAGNSRKELRRTYNHFEKEKYSFEIVPKDRVPDILGELRTISDRWLESKNTKEKGFSIGFFSDSYLKEFPVGVIKKDGAIIAFANLWLGAGKEELSVDLMRYASHETPHGIMDALFTHLMLWGSAEGYQWFNLGVAPLAGLEERSLSPLWNRLGAFIFRHGEHFYNFQGLRHYKDKFEPEWEPKYIASPGGLALPRILTDISALIAGGFKGILTK